MCLGAVCPGAAGASVGRSRRSDVNLSESFCSFLLVIRDDTRFHRHLLTESCPNPPLYHLVSVGVRGGETSLPSAAPAREHAVGLEGPCRPRARHARAAARQLRVSCGRKSNMPNSRSVLELSMSASLVRTSGRRSRAGSARATPPPRACLCRRTSRRRGRSAGPRRARGCRRTGCSPRRSSSG